MTKEALIALPLLLLPILAVYRSASISAEKEHLGLHDSLTDLPNRFNFAAIAERQIDHPLDDLAILKSPRHIVLRGRVVT